MNILRLNKKLSQSKIKLIKNNHHNKKKFTDFMQRSMLLKESKLESDQIKVF